MAVQRTHDYFELDSALIFYGRLLQQHQYRSPQTYMLPENRNCFLKGWKNKGSQEVTASETGKMGG